MATKTTKKSAAKKTAEKTIKPAKTTAEKAPKAVKTATAAKTAKIGKAAPAAKAAKATPAAKPAKPVKAAKAKDAKIEVTKIKAAKAKVTKTKKASELEPEAVETGPVAAEEAEVVATVPTAKIEDPIGDVTDGEAATLLDADAEEGTEDGAEAAEEGDDEPEFAPKPRPPAKLDRLQKILSQAGIASRRKAEEMIEQGRVQVNGKVVTTLGTKADAGRDHIRVDGKLLQGAERLRYFVLNKPKGFVTTVMDPEGRPTVMQFFEKMRERLYPVGRLDYMSEGLLLMTNDGELANKLTKAASGVEKVYLVKVAGQPTEDELDLLRGGVAIERGKPGSPKVRTSPARIRQVRQGDNPWYEVVLIEGRNRELRKMFSAVGHFVEKIRRVGYGPLILDLEPGNLRELEPEELAALRLSADGKLRTPKAKDLRRRNALDAGALPTVTPKPTVHPRPAKPFAPKQFAAKPFAPRPFTERAAPAGGEFRSKRAFGTDRPARPASGPGTGPAKFGGSGRPAAPSGGRPAWKKDDRPAGGKPFGDRPATGRSFGDRPAATRTFSGKPPAGKPYGDRPVPTRVYGAKPGGGKPYGDKPAGRAFPAKPAWKQPEHQEWPAYKRPPASRADGYPPADDLPTGPPTRLQIEPVEAPDRSERSFAARPHTGPVRSSAGRPPRSEGGLARPFTSSSGKPRPGGARPSSKPGKFSKPTGRTYGAGQGSRPEAGARPPFTGARPPFTGARPPAFESRPLAPRSGSIDPRTGSGYRPAPGGGGRPSGPARPFTPREEGASDYRPRPGKPYPDSASRAERKAGTGWKPKKPFGAGKPAAGGRPKPGGFSKSGFKGKPSGSGPKRTGPRPGGGKPGSFGKKRG